MEGGLYHLRDSACLEFYDFSGPFQPSREMMLLFYGYYKQATEGPCTSPKPGFWDLVKKAKW